MKSKKGLIGLVVIVAVLVLGIGYAVVSSVNLSITGTAATETKDLDVVISAANPDDNTTDTFGTVTNPAGKTATITVKNMSKVGETGKRTVTYTVTNKETDIDAKVYVNAASDIVVSKSQYFSVATSITGVGNAITVNAGSTATFTVDVSLIKLPMDAANSTTDITITIKADPVEKSS